MFTAALFAAKLYAYSAGLCQCVLNSDLGAASVVLSWLVILSKEAGVAAAQIPSVIAGHGGRALVLIMHWRQQQQIWQRQNGSGPTLGLSWVWEAVLCFAATCILVI
jgi:hypothetical protein